MRRLLIAFFYFLFTSIVFSKERNTIYIYKDEGVSKQALTQTILTFKDLLKKYNITTINAEEVHQGSWTKNAILFVLPGGADLPYVKKLTPNGNRIIKGYVLNGGSFLGICAGSYYASAYVEFDKNGPLEVLGKRQLSLFKGKSVGPVLAKYDYLTKRGSRAAKILTTIPNYKEAIVFYNGGGFFKDASKFPNTKVIATYENKLPAIIFIDYGKGKVLLSGVHFEYNPYLLDSKDKYIKKIINKLYQGDAKRRILFQELIKLILE